MIGQAISAVAGGSRLLSLAWVYYAERWFIMLVWPPSSWISQIPEMGEKNLFHKLPSFWYSALAIQTECCQEQFAD